MERIHRLLMVAGVELNQRWSGVMLKQSARNYDLADAQAAFDQRAKEPVIAFRFDHAGAHAFAPRIRTRTRPFAIVLNDVVLSTPVIRRRDHLRDVHLDGRTSSIGTWAIRGRAGPWEVTASNIT